MSKINRIIVTSNTNGVDPTGRTSQMDSATMMRECSDLLGRCAQGATASKMELALSPVAAQAKLTFSGAGTAADTVTVGNIEVTMVASGADPSANEINVGAPGAATSVSGASPATTATALQFYVNIDGDGPQLITVSDGGTHTGNAVASAIQAAIRALTAINSVHQASINAATCAYTTVYTITSGISGATSSVVVAGAGASTLKLGVTNGGTETAGTAGVADNFTALINGLSTDFLGMVSASILGQVVTLTAGVPGLIGNGLQLDKSSTAVTITKAFGALVAGSEGTSYTYHLGL